MVEVKNISKNFGNYQALKNVTLSVNKGEVVAILGPSGAGKTTLLRCINFLNNADTGEISINGLCVNCKFHKKKELLELRRKTAMVFQHYNLFNNKTILENVTVGLIKAKKIGKAEAQRRAEYELEKVGLIDRLGAYPSELSGGQQQRVGIARAMALDPDVILFDEPTSALDPEKTAEVLDTIKKVAVEHSTMIIVTHELNFARKVAKQIVFMENGEIVEKNDVETFFTKPRNERSKQFINSILGEFSYTI